MGLAGLRAQPNWPTICVEWQRRCALKRLPLPCLAVLAAALAPSPAFAGSEYSAYQGPDAIRTGTGGSSITKNGIDYWTHGTPPRRYKIVGYLTDRRRVNGLMRKVAGSPSIAKAAKEHGGDAVIIEDQQRVAANLLVSDDVSTLQVIKYMPEDQ